MYILDQYLVIIVPADGLVPNGARPSADTVSTNKISIFLHVFAHQTFFQMADVLDSQNIETYVYRNNQ